MKKKEKKKEKCVCKKKERREKGEIWEKIEENMKFGKNKGERV